MYLGTKIETRPVQVLSEFGLIFLKIVLRFVKLVENSRGALLVTLVISVEMQENPSKYSKFRTCTCLIETLYFFF